MLTNKAYKHDYYNNKEDKMLNPKDVDFLKWELAQNIICLLYTSYEKDKRELFDREPELRDNKKNNEMHLDELEEKYALRKNKLTGQ